MNTKFDLFLFLIAFSIVNSTENLKLVLIGETGVGKSQLGNFILGQEYFKVGYTGNSETKSFNEKTAYIESLNIDVTIVDTQGFNDRETSDNKIMDILVSKFKEDKSIDGIILVYSWAKNRVSQKDIELIDKFKKIFGEDILKQRLKVIYTNRSTGEIFEAEKFKVEININKTKEILNNMVNEKDIIFVNTLNIPNNVKLFYPEIIKILECFYDTKKKHGSMDNELINKNLKFNNELKIKKYEKKLEELEDKIYRQNMEINELENKIEGDKACSLASGFNIPFTLGLSAIRMNECAEKRIQHEKDLIFAKLRLKELEEKKWKYEISIKKLKEEE